jgi:hypothetical protein
MTKKNEKRPHSMTGWGLLYYLKLAYFSEIVMLSITSPVKVGF